MSLAENGGSAARKRAIRRREAILAPLNTLSGKRVNSFRPRFTANDRSRPIHRQAALKGAGAGMPLRPTLEQRGGPVRLARRLRCSGHIARRATAQLRQTRRSPSRLKFSSGVGVRCVSPRKAGLVVGPRSPAFAFEDAPYDTSTAVTGVSWPKLPTPDLGVRAATSVPDQSGAGRTDHFIRRPGRPRPRLLPLACRDAGDARPPAPRGQRPELASSH